MRRAVVVFLAVLLMPLVACGKDQTTCSVVGNRYQLTLCAEADPVHAELHILTDVKAQPKGDGMFLDSPDVIRRAPYTATVDYKVVDQRGNPTGVLVTMKVIPRSPNIKHVSCSIYDGTRKVAFQIKTADMYNTEAVCVYETKMGKKLPK